MAGTTLGVKVDDELKMRLKAAAKSVGRTPHWLIKHALMAEVERIEKHGTLAAAATDHSQDDEDGESTTGPDVLPHPFLDFAQSVQPQSVLRAQVTAAYRRPETDCLPLLLSEASLPQAQREAAAELARGLVVALRDKKRSGGSGVEALIQEYSLSSHEGVALMCLAEALLRIPDRPTRDALIRDKISRGDWQAHVGRSSSVFVNAATWGLVVTGKLTTTNSERGLSAALSRLIGLGGEPLIRKGVDIAMRMMGEQFVTGQTIGEALANSRRMESKGFRYSYDMLGEAATTGADAQRYFEEYEQAVHAIGKAANRRGIYDAPGISVKLSALHPRYSRSQRERVLDELFSRLKTLALAARRYDIGFNIDAEEADRLDLSLDLLEKLCFDPELAGWHGIGFAVQAYQKRALSVIEWAIDLARRSRRRIMIRLVKGAYWDTEIKRAQVDGLEDFPVFTRKLHTDVSYLACSKKLLSAPDAIYPQFATHNALTVAAVMQIAGPNYYAGQYEFQCLHGMGEPLYDEIVGADKFNRPCRVYAPVGTHETLLAYLVRRLLENGANSSFVNRVADAAVPVSELIVDPVTAARALSPVGLPHPKILHPRALFGDARPNSNGLDLSNEQRLASLSAALLAGAEETHTAKPLIGDTERDGVTRPVRNPADDRDLVGLATDATLRDVDEACAAAVAAAPIWDATPVNERAAALWRTAELLETRMASLMGLLCREAGKSLPNAIAEVREAVDFLRYYSIEAVSNRSPTQQRSLGPVVCISPWNFPLAIFTGQVAAALAAGNSVIAKPAEETPLIAAAMIRILREAGVPAGALQLVPGDGAIGAALVADPRIRGVLFTGSTEVARSIQRELARRLTPDGGTIPLIAETGGQNALIVDSSALPEQVVNDVITSAFDSAGQRCSALRILCLQEEIADRVLDMLKGAMQELCIGAPDRLSVDIGPVITANAKAGILSHIEAMRAKGRAVYHVAIPETLRHGHFVAPTIIEIEQVSELEREVFGPVLHVLRYRRDELEDLLDAINSTGYGLTFGLHTRIDETIAYVTDRIRAGNIYINRNTVGAVVGVQPFGGQGLSGTGPKAGGPLYLSRLARGWAPAMAPAALRPLEPAVAYLEFLKTRKFFAAAERVTRYLGASGIGVVRELDGPVGESNLYEPHPRGAIAALAQTEFGLLTQLGAILASGNRAIVPAVNPAKQTLEALPPSIQTLITTVPDWHQAQGVGGVLFEGDADGLLRVNQVVAELDGPIVLVQGASVSGLVSGEDDYSLDLLVHEVSISTNTAAAGGNASLMAIG
ncbi:MAG TPA: trifunctional transcriptional regulator/proline dehydrogenase/L-glutamate gamma-semialdehyde dehydrogenase [Steroidobacteraceae bacterium]|nr:trifunctional transcriptional regulator/proline dehydrogenase/L-glutamate gamma-semialdehyde dehydrogenase [Steroidobacteraceae bacterium]